VGRKRERKVYMRRFWLRFFTGSVLVAALSAAAILGFAGGGQAASPNICATPTNPTTGVYASCVTQLVLPHKVNFGGFSQSVVRFKNEGASTASHVSLQTAFSSGVRIDAIRLLLNDVVQSTGSCAFTPASTSLPANGVTLVKCTDFANFAPGNTGKLVVRFSFPNATTSTDVTVTSAALYAESGNDNAGGPNSTRNDQQRAKPETVTFVPAGEPASGSCTSAGGSFTDGNALQTTTIFYNTTTDASLLCTPADAGVDTTTVAGQTFVSFVELVAQSGPGYANVFIDFTPVPAGTTIKKLVLKEALPPLFDFSTSIIVPPCDPSGLPPSAGTPPALGPPQVNDSCVFDRVSLPKGGGRLILHVIGGTVDPRYVG
jgi:hypothetical protein